MSNPPFATPARPSHPPVMGVAVIEAPTEQAKAYAFQWQTRRNLFCQRKSRRSFR